MSKFFVTIPIDALTLDEAEKVKDNMAIPEANKSDPLALQRAFLESRIEERPPIKVVEVPWRAVALLMDMRYATETELANHFGDGRTSYGAGGAIVFMEKNSWPPKFFLSDR